jgi:hypothetical protein
MAEIELRHPQIGSAQLPTNGSDLKSRVGMDASNLHPCFVDLRTGFYHSSLCSTPLETDPTANGQRHIFSTQRDQAAVRAHPTAVPYRSTWFRAPTPKLLILPDLWEAETNAS